MKILYIGHYKEGGGWANAAINTILALDSAGIDVVCRNVKLTDTNVELPARIIELEKKSLQDVDYCIQNVLPHHIVGTQKFKKNIVYFFSESKPLRSNWISELNLADEVWVANHDNMKVLEDSGIEVPIRIVGVPFDCSSVEKPHNKLDLGAINHKYKFYYVGDVNDRKNISAIVKCFHAEFEPHEPVALVLKINKFGLNPEQLKNTFVEMSNGIKSQMRISNNIQDFCTEFIIPNRLSEEQMLDLHNTCDCFISPTHGEAWSIPAFEAMCFGNTPICSNEGGPKDFIDELDSDTGMLIDGVYSVCDHGDPAFPDIFTGKEEWFTPSESQIKKTMRFYYETKDVINRSSGLKQAQKFNYKIIANKIKEYLSE